MFFTSGLLRGTSDIVISSLHVLCALIYGLKWFSDLGQSLLLTRVVEAEVAVVRLVRLRFGRTIAPGLVQSRQLFLCCPAASFAENQRIRDVSERPCSAGYLSLLVCPRETRSSTSTR